MCSFASVRCDDAQNLLLLFLVSILLLFSSSFSFFLPLCCHEAGCWDGLTQGVMTCWNEEEDGKSLYSPAYIDLIIPSNLSLLIPFK